MNIQISVRRMTVSQVMKRVVRDLCSDIQNKCNRIQDIDVKIEDINGHNKSGMDKRCHLKVRGKERLAIDVEEVDEDLHSAIDNAFRRLTQVLLMRTAKPAQNMIDPFVWN
jgi:ribosome-associated translation inhibitor RaiA